MPICKRYIMLAVQFCVADTERLLCLAYLAGDYHHADIKMADPASDALYSTPYQTTKLKQNVIQVGTSV
eukprot:scaffold343350_cov34-Prasinocladus_malaysianus.AAC.1